MQVVLTLLLLWAWSRERRRGEREGGVEFVGPWKESQWIYDVWALLWEGLSPDRQENTSLQCVFLLTLVPNIHTWHTRLRHLSAHPSPPPPPSLSTSGASVWPVLKLSWWWCSSLTVVWAEERQTGRKPMRRKERDMSGPQSLGRSLTVEKVCSSSLGLPAETTVSRKWRG